MTELKTIQYSGINRAVPQSMAPDGSCQEIINSRFRKGCWRPIGEKMHYLINGNAVDIPEMIDEVYLHDIENGFIPGEPNWIGYDNATGNVYLLDPTDTDAESGTLITTIINKTDVSIVFLKRTMIICSGDGVKVFLYTETSPYYAQTAEIPVPDVMVSRTTAELVGVESDNTQTGEAILGKFYENLNKLSENEGWLYGSIMYMVAYRLFDGSYILPSIPRYVELSNGGNLKYRNPGGDSREDNEFRLDFAGYKIQASIDCSVYAGFETTKDLIESICIFATKATPLHQFDITALSVEKLSNVYGTKYNSEHHIDTWSFEKVFPVISNDFKDLAKSTSWYKVHEFDFEKIVTIPYVLVEPIDTKGYYQDYATRETLIADQFTHHTLSAKAALVYNDRLHLLNIKTSPGLPYVSWHAPDTFVQMTTIPGKITTSLKTSLGKCTVVHDVDIPVYRKTSDMQNYILIPEVVGYNDSRATKITIIAIVADINYILLSESLTKNVLMNFSFWHKTAFSLVNDVLIERTTNYSMTEILAADITTKLPASNPVSAGLPFDTNRLQVSEIQNPLIFPAKYSYQIGTGDGLTMAAGSEPLSTGQFGQFPLQVFTTKGIWALEIGLGDVLYTNVLPSSPEVIENRKNVISVGSGVVYSTHNGLFVLNGRQSTQLSEIVEGKPSIAHLIGEINTLIDPGEQNTHFTKGLSETLSTVDFLTYLQNSQIGFDYDNHELVVTNASYHFSYIYSFESKMWFKISKSFTKLINNYPKLIGVTSDSVLSISQESDAQEVQVMFITNAQSFDAPDSYKKLERFIQRIKFGTEYQKVIGIYLFASDDLVTWQLMVGRQREGSYIKDLLVQRTPGSARHFVIVLNGTMKPDSEIKQIETLVKIKWNNRLR